jgi:hypothetical protein
MWVAFCLRAFFSEHTDSWYICLLLPSYTFFMNPAGPNLNVYVVLKTSSVLQYITQHGTVGTKSKLKLKKKGARARAHTHTHTHWCIQIYVCTFKHTVLADWWVLCFFTVCIDFLWLLNFCLVQSLYSRVENACHHFWLVTATKPYAFN